MNLHTIDWLILAIPVLIVGVVSWITRKHMKSVADFMSASRCAGRYLICNAAGEAACGAISVVAIFEYIYKAGFAISWWAQMSIPLGLFIALSGYVIYRYRESRVMTMSQFLEVRYSKGFRIFAGVVTFISGVLNFGIFPVVAARFFVNYLGLPQTLSVIGMALPTHVPLMALFIAFSLFYTLLGGQLTIMISDCLEGLLSGVFYVVVAVALLCIFSWSEIYTAMAAAPAGESMFNPFDTANAKDFNIWYVLIGVAGSLYGYMSWQGGHAFRSSAANAHEAKMGNILGGWRGVARGVMITLLGICAFTYMNHPDFATQAAGVQAALNNIDSPQIQTQMRVPVALAHLLPIGIIGMFGSIMFFAMVACDGSYMHSWGSIFIQDVILPFRKKPFAPEQHIRVLRWSIAAVGIFAFLFGTFFKQTDYILMFFALTGAIISGLGSAIIGGFYWKKGTNAGAWSSMIIGSCMAVGGILIQQSWKDMVPWLMKAVDHPGIQAYLANHADKFPINGQVIGFYAMLASVLTYVIVSLLTCKEAFNMDRMLHRGKYSIEAKPGEGHPPTSKTKWTWASIIGIDREFTVGDKWLSGSLFVWSMFWFVVFLVGTAWYMIWPWPLETWGKYWYFTGILLPLGIGAVTTVWFTIGGIHDLIKLFRSLNAARRDERDDGMVVNHHNLDELPAGSDDAQTH